MTGCGTGYENHLSSKRGEVKPEEVIPMDEGEFKDF